MSVVDRDRFLQCVSKSGVLSPEVYDQWVAELDSDASSLDLALDLVAKKLTTKWQAQMLAKGASRLTLGNYLLTDRMEKSEIGDRFKAVHQQLSRDVAIHYLKQDVCESKELKKKVLAVGSKLADLDHPNLVHVYDVDEEKDRVYLVCESGNGMMLKDYLREQSPLSCESIAKMVAGCVSGLSYAHSKGVVHGGVSPKTLSVKPRGDVKVRGLTQFAVQNALSETPATENDDMLAVKSIGKLLLGSVDEAEKSSEAYATLRKAIKAIPQDAVTALDVLEDIAKSENDSSIDEELMLAPAAELESVDSAQSLGLVAPVGSAMAVSNPAKEAPEGFLTSLARRNPAALIAASVLTALLLIGGTVFAATQLTASSPKVAVADAADKKEASRKTDKKKSEPKSRKRSKASKAERPNFRNRTGALSGTSAAVVPGSATDPEANKSAIAALFNKPSKEEDAVPASQAATRVPKDEVVVNAAPKPVPAPKPVEEPKVEVTVAEVEKAVEKAKPKTRPKKGAKQETIAAGSDPFEKFAKEVDLPEFTNTEQASFGKLILEKKHLLGAEILSTPASHRSKPLFEIKRSADDKQAWDISYKKRKKADPVVIAKLQKTPDQLLFNWLPAAAEIEAANYLRNCRFKFSTASHSHWLTLRKPFKIEGFSLGEDKGAVKLDVNVPYLPNPAALGASLNTIKFEPLDKEDRGQRAQLDPSEISARSPARMYFHKDADRFLSLDVTADIRKKLVLRAALVLQPSKEQPGVVLDPRNLGQVTQQIRGMASAARQEAKKANDMKGLSKDDKKAYERVSKKAAGQAELTGFYEHVIPQVLNKNIPVTITYSLNDQHRIVLAYTVESGGSNKAKSKKKKKKKKK